MKKDFYIYEWFNIDTGEVFYVGKGRLNRFRNTTQRNTYFKNYFNKYNCDVRKVHENLEEHKAFEIEKETIKKYRDIGQCKCNLADGGEGTTFPKGSWNDLFRKLQYLHDVQYSMDDMYTEEDYDPKNLKTKSLEELESLYQEFYDFKENKRACKELGLNRKLPNSFEFKCQNKEIAMLTTLIANGIAMQHKKFNEFLNYKTEADFYCSNIDADEFLKLIISDFNYLKELFYIIMDNLWLLKEIGKNQFINFPIKVKSYSIKDDHIHIKFNTLDFKKPVRVKIHMHDIVWGILMFKDKEMHQIIYDEMIVAPFL